MSEKNEIVSETVSDVVPDVSSSNEEVQTASHSTDEPEIKKNPKTVVCNRCESKVLLPDTATHVKKNVFLPLMTSKGTIPPPPTTAISGDSGEETCSALYVLPEIPGEVLEDFWFVADMYTFENVGVSHTVGTLKYLTCADCEIGPIGYQDLEKKNEFFVAWNRVAEK